YKEFKAEGHSKKDISELIAVNLNVKKILKKAAADWDGGYAIAGLIGHGDAFVMRDPSGIRPAYYYMDDEVVIATSERPAIQTAFNVSVEDIHEIQPGHVLIIKKDGSVSEKKFKEPLKKPPCSFERI